MRRSPESSRSGDRPMWIAVAWWRIPAANNTQRDNLNTAVDQVNGQSPGLVRVTHPPSAGVRHADGEARIGGGATPPSTGRNSPTPGGGSRVHREPQRSTQPSAPQATEPNTAREDPRPPNNNSGPGGRKTKAALGLGTLNISGRGNLTGPVNNKWNAINQLLKDERLGLQIGRAHV